MEVKKLASENGVQPEAVTAPESIRKRSRKRNIVVFAVTCVLSVGLLALIWSQLVTPASQAANTGNSSLTAGGPLIGKPAPDFTLPTLNGDARSMHLADLKGKVVVLNFWASWCGPCNDEAPILTKSWSTFKGKDVVMVGIDASYSTQEAQSFMKQYGVTYPNVEDTTNRTTAVAYGVTALPETFFINRAGLIVAHYAGPVTSEQALQSEVAKIAQ